MNTASLILSVAALTPVAIFFGLSVTAAFSLAAAAGLLAIAVADYGRTPGAFASSRVLAYGSAAKTERLALAA